MKWIIKSLIRQAHSNDCCYLHWGTPPEVITPVTNDFFLLMKKQRPLETIYFHLEETARHFAFYIRTMSTLALCCHLKQKLDYLTIPLTISYYTDDIMLIGPEQEER